MMTNQCVYECPCDQTGCDVTYVDTKKDYVEHEANVCEIEVIWSVTLDSGTWFDLGFLTKRIDSRKKIKDNKEICSQC